MKKVLLLITSSLILSSCGGNFQRGDNFSVLNGGEKQEFGKRGFKFLSELNLTQAQKDKLASLKSDMMKDNKEQVKNILKQAFLSDSINKEELKSKLNSIANDEKLDKMSKSILEVYNTLTKEQKDKIKEKLSKMDSKENKKGFFTKHKEHFKSKMLDKISSDLGLTSEQKEKAKELFNNTENNRTDMKAKFKSIIEKLDQVLSNGGDAGKVKEVLLEVKKDMNSKMDSKLDNMIKLHSILNKEQREKLVNKLEEKSNKMKGKMKHKGF